MLIEVTPGPMPQSTKVAHHKRSSHQARDDAETLCPAVPWRDVRGIGNWLRHQYDRVKPETVWNTITDDLPLLKSAVEKALKSEDSPSSPER